MNFPPNCSESEENVIKELKEKARIKRLNNYQS